MKLSPIIAGCMRWGIWGAGYSTQEFKSLINECIEAGIDSFDHADIYGDYTTEADFGNALKEDSSLRQKIKIITKCGIRRVSAARPQNIIKSYDTSKDHIIASAEQSLKNFHTDYLDVLLIHRPDPVMNPEEIAAAFSHLKESGKVLSFGVSNFNTHQSALLHHYFPLEFNQLEISAQQLDTFLNGTLDFCTQHKIQTMAWSPLGAGKLFSEEMDERTMRIMAVAKILAERYKVSAENILINWLMQHPTKIKPVLGTTKIRRLRDAMKANYFNITREEWFMLWRASTGVEVP
jgi:predicted oxidoreductase